MVGLFGRFKVFFQTRLKLVNIFNVGDDKRTTNDFSPIVVIPMVLPFRTKPSIVR